MHNNYCIFPGMSSKGAEIARRYRERRNADSDRRQQYLQQERDRWKKDRETGKKKGVNELSEREKRAKRKKWREAKQQVRARNKASALRQSETPPETPPSSSPENQPEPGPSRLDQCKQHVLQSDIKATQLWSYVFSSST